MTHDELKTNHYARLNAYRDSQEYAEFAKSIGHEVEPGDKPSLLGQRWDIDSEIYHHFLEILPPLGWKGGSFYMQEFTFDDITAKFTKEGDKYYCEFAQVSEASGSRASERRPRRREGRMSIQQLSEKPLKELLNEAYEAFDGSDELQDYTKRHEVESAAILTVTDDETAALIAASLSSLIGGKTVVEIGGGIGLLAMHMGMYAERVYCIEANPVWASSFIASLFVNKQKHVSYLFGSADEFAGQIHGDVALFCTHSGVDSMKQAASKFAPIVFDVYGELIASNPAAFDERVARLRKVI